MNKTELIEKIAANAEVSKAVAKKALVRNYRSN